MAPRKLDRSLIRGFDLFRDMTEDNLDAVLATVQVRTVEPGEPVFSQGAAADEFFLLLHGHLKVVQVTPSGEQVVVRHVLPGEVFGIARAIRRTDYPATAEAVTESIVLAWMSTQWPDFVALNPVLAVNALEAVGERLQEAHTRIRELSTEEVERRVAHALLRLVRRAGRPEEGGIRIDFPLTRQDIAEMTGTTLHTVSRLLSAWEAQGIVKSARRKIAVTDEARLAALARG
ncbi:Crp/Fnr family transcriptional regulator [Pleomorphomonas koreensis]|uniref:Crp/Fnr family transcriptional regulator n=1 Tax=Pleomorphomonas koreensis TaxID=257440 RepID=UPI000560E6D6|nr:Crp/Fnr family transcriptional regulator [Pleomorphomonas koreensis]